MKIDGEKEENRHLALVWARLVLFFFFLYRIYSLARRFAAFRGLLMSAGHER